MGTRPDIPDPIKREVRQRCGFGCVICGLPVYEYDHMVGWAETERHQADEITLLCSQHHAEKTRGLRTREQIQAADAKPFNRQRGISAPFGLSLDASEPPVIRMGSNWITSPDDMTEAVVIDDFLIFGFRREGSQLYLRLIVFNEYNQCELVIEDNVLVASTGVWDIQFEGQVLKVRRAARDIILQLRFEPPSTVRLERASLVYNGVLIEVKENAVDFEVNGIQVHTSGNSIVNRVAIMAGNCPDYWRHGVRGVFHMPDTDRYGGRVKIATPRVYESDAQPGDAPSQDEARG